MSLASFLSVLWSLEFWLALLIILFLRSLIKTWTLWKKMPPGPFPWPIFGNLLIFRGTKVGTHETLIKLSKKYGDLMTIFFFHTPSVVITKYDQAKSILSQTNFSSRQESALFDTITEGGHDLVFSRDTPVWQFYRKAITKGIRSIIEAEKLENQILDVVDDTIKHMLMKPENIELPAHVRHIVINILTSLAFGKIYKKDDPELMQISSMLEAGSKEFTNAFLVDFLPYAKHLPLRSMFVFSRGFDMVDQFKRIRLRYINEHRQSYAKGEVRDFCDAMLLEQESLRNEQPEQADLLNDINLSWIVMDFFNAGTDTTRSMLSWIFLYMVIYPEIQEECYQEIKEVIGDRIPRLSDRPKLPFLESCILETLRLRPAAPLGVPHAPISDSKIGDYFIPHGTIVMPNIYAMQIDPEHWEKPLEFNPRLHFLDENGQLKKPTSFAPFGFGRRVCIGEQLARNDIFLVATRVLQLIRLEPLEGKEYNANYDYEADLTLQALPYSVRAVLRN